jgi:predicted HTH domain antitoxin
MKTIELQVPDSLLLNSSESVEDLTRTSQFLLAVKFFEIGRLSSGQAARMCGINRVDFLLELGRMGIPVADLTGSELEEELRNA